MSPKKTIASDLLADPFGEMSRKMVHGPLHLLGARFLFESNSRDLLRLVDSAYAGLPRHRLSAVGPRLKVSLLLTPDHNARRRKPTPPLMSLFSGTDSLGGATASSNFMVVSPAQRSALMAVSPTMLKFPYHVRYEFIEFAVLTLAARCQGLVPLHAACVGEAGRGIVLVGSSGSGKSTVTLHCLLEGLQILSEDSVYVEPRTMLATGIANFLHLRRDSLHWLGKTRTAAAIRRSPVIERRSGIEKFEVDLREGDYALAGSSLKIAAVVFLSPERAGNGSQLRGLSKAATLDKLASAQAYAAGRPEWAVFGKGMSKINGFELRRGRHPLETVQTLRSMLR
jgi:hypothetical protein